MFDAFDPEKDRTLWLFVEGYALSHILQDVCQCRGQQSIELLPKLYHVLFSLSRIQRTYIMHGRDLMNCSLNAAGLQKKGCYVSPSPFI